MVFIRVFIDDTKYFLLKNYIFILFYFLLLIFFYFISPFKTIEDTIFNNSSDEWVWFRTAKLMSQVNIIGYFKLLSYKYIFNSILINNAWTISQFLRLPDLIIYAALKSIFHLISVPLFYKIVNLNFTKKISILASLFYLFDPYLFSLKYCLLRDDLIVSFSIIFIYTYIYILNNNRLKDIYFLILIYFCLYTLRPLQSIALLFITPLSFFLSNNIYNWKINFSFNSKIKYKNIFIIIIFLIIFIRTVLGHTLATGLELLQQTNLAFIPLAFKNFYFSPLPTNIIDIISGNIESDALRSYYWFLVRFFLLAVTFLTLIFILIIKPFRIKIIRNFMVLISFSNTFLYGIFSTGAATLGPRQGYLSYVFLIPLVIQILFLYQNSNLKKTLDSKGIKL